MEPEIKMKKGLIFIGGAAIGSLITYFITDKKLKDKYMKIADDSIQSIKESYRRKTEELAQINRKKDDISVMIKEKNVVPAENEKQEDLNPYDHVLEQTKINIFEPNIHYISEEEYYEMNGFEKEELTYYRDGVLANEHDDVIPIETSIGTDAIERIKENADCLYIRNESLMTDYMADYCDKSFFEITGKYVKELYDQ